MTIQNKNAETAATISAKKQNSHLGKGEVMNQTIRTQCTEIKCARCETPRADGNVFVFDLKLECNCPCHDGIPPATAPAPDAKRYIGGELARIVYGNGGLASRIRANRNTCTCGGV